MSARFIDVSSFQPHVDFRAVKRSGVAGVWIKATEGVTYTNPYAAAQTQRARAAGLRVGYYHYARPADNAADAEARHFASAVKSLGGIKRRDLRPALDLERNTALTRFVPWSREFNLTVKRLLGVGPLFYSYGPYIHGLRADKPIGWGLWLAYYGVNDGKVHTPVVPAPWKRVACHQFTSRGTVPGVPGHCDVSTGALRKVVAHRVIGLL